MPAAGLVDHAGRGGVFPAGSGRTGPHAKIADRQEVVTVLRLLPAQLPWRLAGPGMGLCLVALYGLANRPMNGAVPTGRGESGGPHGPSGS